MTAIGVTTYGGPEALHPIDVEPEPLGPGDVRLRVTAAAVNPTDTGVRSGLRDDKPDPAPPGAVPGMDAAGEVVEVGSDVATGIAVGDRVMAIVTPAGAHGAYRSDLVVPARSVTRVPRGASDAEAATLPMNGLTARFALDSLHLQPGDVLAVTGAAGAFGGYVIQLAKADGLTVVADAADKDRELIEQPRRRRDPAARRLRRRGARALSGRRRRACRRRGAQRQGAAGRQGRRPDGDRPRLGRRGSGTRPRCSR